MLTVSELVSLLPIIAIAVLFWLLLIRPTQKRQKRMAQMQASVGVHDRVVLTSGIHGVVTALNDDTVEVEVAPEVVLTVTRGAIGQTQAAESDTEDPDTDADAGESYADDADADESDAPDPADDAGANRDSSG